MWFIEDTVGNLEVNARDMFVIVKENLFPKSLTDATIQDGGTREKGMMLKYNYELLTRFTIFYLSHDYVTVM